MFWKMLKVFLIVGLGAGSMYVADRFRQLDMIERHAAELSKAGLHDRGVFIQDMRGILGTGVALALVGATGDYQALRAYSLSLAHDVVAGKLPAKQARHGIVSKAAPSYLNESLGLAAFVRDLRRNGINADWIKVGAKVLLRVPIAQAKLKAAVALAVAENPDRPDLAQVLEKIVD